MIASVSGTVQARRPDHVVIDCGGVGYRLSVSAKTLDQVPAAGQSANLLSHLILKDDGIQLYGFATEAERELFLRLISVSGIGPKMALAALSGSSVGELRKAIAAGDAKRFQVVPGIGRKTAERVIVELRERSRTSSRARRRASRRRSTRRAPWRATGSSGSGTTPPRRMACWRPRSRRSARTPRPRS